LNRGIRSALLAVKDHASIIVKEWINSAVNVPAMWLVAQTACLPKHILKVRYLLSVPAHCADMTLWVDGVSDPCFSGDTFIQKQL
jgi:hypothetical protein